MSRGKFITIEGGEGSGKSTNLSFIARALADSGIPLITTREPGGTEYGESIRSLLLQHRDEPLATQAELLLVFAARAQHLSQKIIPALEQGSWVLSDRFTDATYAYQGAGRGLDVNFIAQLETLVQGPLRPDMTIYLDVDVNTGMDRASARAELDRFEVEQLDFFERVRTAYLNRAAQYPEIYRVIDATQSLPDVQRDITAVLNSFVQGART